MGITLTKKKRYEVDYTEPSKERKVRERLTAEFGSMDNYNARQELTKRDQELVSSLKSNVTLYHAWKEEALAALERLPFWADAEELQQMPLGALGAPELSDEWNGLSSGGDVRALLGMKVYRDYTALGWPKSAGKPVRYVTPQEDEEILRRLKDGGLTLPGSEVPLVSMTLRQLFVDNQPGPEWLLEGLLRRSGSMMVYGPSGVGKTWFTQTLVWLAATGGGAAINHQETGEPLLKAGTREGLKVLVLDGEMTEADLKARGVQIAQMLGQTQAETDEIAENVTLYVKTKQDHRAWFPDVVSPEWRARIIEHCQQERFDLVVFDNLTTLSPSLEDENSATAWSPFNDLVIGLKKAGVAVLAVHHSNKAKTGYRGSTAIEATLETVVRLDALEGDHPEKAKGAGFKVEVTKDRAHGKPSVHDKTLLLRDGAWVAYVDLFDNCQRVLEAVKSRRYATQKEVADALGLGSQGTVSKIFTAIEATVQGVTKSDLHRWLSEAKELRKAMEAQEDTGEELLEELVI